MAVGPILLLCNDHEVLPFSLDGMSGFSTAVLARSVS